MGLKMTGVSMTFALEFERTANGLGYFMWRGDDDDDMTSFS